MLTVVEHLFEFRDMGIRSGESIDAVHFQAVEIDRLDALVDDHRDRGPISFEEDFERDPKHWFLGIDLGDVGRPISHRSQRLRLRRRRRAELRRDLWGPTLIDAWCPLGGALRAVQRSRDLLCA